MEADFAGWVTKAGLKCSDGRTILPNAFAHQDKEQVPLVWMHGHDTPTNVLGHVLLENRPEGVYGYGFFNGSDTAIHMAHAVDNKDVNQMSIWANNLIQRDKDVMHGKIKEVSLVLAGANPGAVIESVTIRHSADDVEVVDDEFVLKPGLGFDLHVAHSDDGEGEGADDGADDGAADGGADDGADDGAADGNDDGAADGADADNADASEGDDDGAADGGADDSNDNNASGDDGVVSHASSSDEGGDQAISAETVGDVYNTFNPKQKEVVHFMLGEAFATAGADNDSGSADSGDSAAHSNTDKDGGSMANVFEGKEKDDASTTLSHDDLQNIVKHAKKHGSLKDAVEAFVESYSDGDAEHGITNISTLFPEAKNVTDTPEFFARRMEWVNSVLNGARKSPFSRIRSMSADLTFEDARAKGYIKGNLKKEEFFPIASRSTYPTTIYKKQKLDRDDMIDITDFDVVIWLKGEMRVMLDEEIARAILLGDGRDPGSDEKISETSIRPIATDHELYTSVVSVNLGDANSSIMEAIDQVIANRAMYRGSGTPNFYTTENFIAKCLTLKDTVGRRIYKSLDEVATEMRVKEIVPVEAMEDYPAIVGVMVNMADYTIGADKGGAVSMFDDFDIDYNQYKYLIETRISGALTKLKSAIVVKSVASNLVLVTPAKPAFNGDAITITNQTGVVYKNGAGTTITATDNPIAVADGVHYVVNATPATGYYFGSSDDDSWEFIGDVG